jgi:hypothetical protein
VIEVIVGGGAHAFGYVAMNAEVFVGATLATRSLRSSPRKSPTLKKNASRASNPVPSSETGQNTGVAKLPSAFASTV